MLMNEARSSTAGRWEERPFGRLLRSLGSVSLFYKVLFANGLLIFVATVTGMVLAGWVTGHALAPERWGLAGYALAVTALSLLVNAAVLHAAFLPLQRLEATAEAIRRGDRDRRVPRSLLSDPAIARLIDTFNAMLTAQEWQRAELAALSSRTLDAQEEERRRIARELHDQTAQELTALLVRIRLAADGSREPATRERLAELRAATARTLDGVRRMARELRPSILDDLGLAEAVRAYAQETLAGAGIQVVIRTNGLADRLDPTHELVLYRVLQEALSNVAKHAGATRVDVTIEPTDNAVVATVGDNGRGFAPSQRVAPTGQGLGLLGMRERLALVAGWLELDTQPGGGTTLRATVPTRSVNARAEHATSYTR